MILKQYKVFRNTNKIYLIPYKPCEGFFDIIERAKAIEPNTIQMILTQSLLLKIAKRALFSEKNISVEIMDIDDDLIIQRIKFLSGNNCVILAGNGNVWMNEEIKEDTLVHVLTEEIFPKNSRKEKNK